jgi:rare lipoprotein A
MQLRQKSSEPRETLSDSIIRQRGPFFSLLFVVFFCGGCASIADVSLREEQTPRGSLTTGDENSNSQKTPRFVQSGKASWYGPGFHGRVTASGEPFDEAGLTAAHKSFPLGSKAKVTNLTNGNSVEVKINDRGPFTEGRIIDLSRAAARALGILESGIALVRVELIAAASAQ